MAEEKKMTAQEAEAKLKAAQAAAAAAEAEAAAAKARAEAAAAEAELAAMVKDTAPAAEETKTEETIVETPEEKPKVKKLPEKTEEEKEQPKKKKTAKQKSLEKAVELRAEGKSATGLRIGAIVLWIAALACEILAIRMFNLAEETLSIVFIVADAITCIIGSLLWKRSNKIDPPSKKNKFTFFLKSQLGLIACLICFIPLGILLLKNQNLSAKSKKLIAIIAAVAFLGTAGASLDYAPVSAEEVAHAEAMMAATGNVNGDVFWTRWGKSYHVEGCHTLNNTKPENLFSGSIAEAMAAKRSDPCDFCFKDVEELDSETLEALVEGLEDVVTDEAAA